MSCGGGILNSAQWVGDPVDVVSGARAEISLDFRVAWPVAFEWRRYWDSTKLHLTGELGHGHAHEFERWLEFTTDGIRLLTPIGNATDFPALTRDGATAVTPGLILSRVTLLRYRLSILDGPVMEFEFLNAQAKGLLKTIRQGEDSLQLEHDAKGRVTRARSFGKSDDIPEVRFLRAETGKLTSLELNTPGAQPRTIATFEYDGAGNLIRETDPYKNAFRFQYDKQHRCTKRTDPRGYSFNFAYDEKGRCTFAAGEDGLHEVKLRYLPEQGVTQVTRGDGGLWQYFYTPQGVLTQIVDPYAGLRVYALENGRIAQEIDPAGNATKFLYDPTGAPAAKVDSAGRFLLPNQDAPKPNHKVADNPAQYEFGRAARTIAPAEPRFAPRAGSTYAHWLMPNPLAPVEGERTDPFGILTRQDLKDGASRRWVYTANAWVEKYTDADNRAYTYAYTSWNQLASETRPSGATTWFRYNKERDTTGVTDAGGTTSEYEYDLKDRLVRVKRLGTLVEEYKYNPADRLIEKLDGKGNTLLKLEAGPGGLMTRRKLASGEDQTFEYDKAGRLAKASGSAGKCEFEHDFANRRTADLRDGKGVTADYESDGELRFVEVLAKFRTTYSRTPAGDRLIRDPGGNVHTFRIAQGRAERTHSNGSSELTELDPAGRILSRVVNHAAAARWTRRFSYSAEGDLLKLDDSASGATTFEYDPDHRLTRMFRAGREELFLHDEADNLVQQPGLSNVELAPGNRMIAANGETFEFNDRAAVASRSSPSGTTTYHRDSRGRLLRATLNSREWSAKYDILSRRTSKTWLGQTTTYYWESDRLAAEVSHAGAVRVYLYADALAITPFMFMEFDSIDAKPDQGRRYFIYSDQVGAPRVVENEQGTLVWRARLDSYGKAEIDPHSTITLHLRFPGHLHDPELGLHYNRFRYYDPALGRYLESDPIGLEGGINLYAYSTRPLVYADVRGLCPAPRNRSNQSEDGDDRENPPRPADIDDIEGQSAIGRAVGMDGEDLGRLAQIAKDDNQLIIVRATNPNSLDHHGDGRAIPKPVTCKLKTDPETGMVMQRSNPGEPAPPGFHYDREGYLCTNDRGQRLYGDHDLQGVYQRNGETDDDGFHGTNSNDPRAQQRINEAFPGRDMVAHGANDDYRPGGQMGRQPGENERFLVVEPDGTSRVVGPPTSALQDYYDSKGIDWPYDNYHTSPPTPR